MLTSQTLSQTSSSLKEMCAATNKRSLITQAVVQKPSFSSEILSAPKSNFSTQAPPLLKTYPYRQIGQNLSQQVALNSQIPRIQNFGHQGFNPIQSQTRMFKTKIKSPFFKVSQTIGTVHQNHFDSYFDIVGNQRNFFGSANKNDGFNDKIISKDDIKQKLKKAIDGEIKYENQNYEQFEYIEMYLYKSGFQYKESEDSKEMTLLKQVDDKLIEVVFESRQIQQSENNVAEEQNTPDSYNQQIEAPENLGNKECDFTIFHYFPNSNDGLIVEAMTTDAQISFKNVITTNDITKLRQSTRIERFEKVYTGPDFDQLEEKIQTSLYEYFGGFGVDNSMGGFIFQMSLDKDQRLYMKWLNDLNDILSK